MPVAVRISRARFTDFWQRHVHGDVIAAHFGIDRSTVTKLARRYGLTLRHERRAARWAIPFERSAEFTDMWRGMVKSGHIAAHFGVNRKTVENHAKRLLLPLRGKGSNTRWLDLSQWRDLQLRDAMAASARKEQAALRLAEMVDKIRDPSHIWRKAA
jgi:hypothetical protein